jgi:hypothetical protein
MMNKIAKAKELSRDVCVGAYIYDRETHELLGIGTMYGGKAANYSDSDAAPPPGYPAQPPEAPPNPPPPSPPPSPLPPPPSPPPSPPSPPPSWMPPTPPRIPNHLWVPPPPSPPPGCLWPFSCAPPTPPFKPFDETLAPEVNQAQLDSNRYIVFLGMFFRGPLSPKISAVWFLLIAALGPLIREEKAAKAAYTETKTLKKLAPFVVARVIMYTLVPLVIVLASLAIVSMVFAVIAMFWQWQLFGVWASLISILLVKIPVFALFDALGCGDEKVDYTGIENRATKWIIAASEGAEFKYVLTVPCRDASLRPCCLTQPLQPRPVQTRFSLPPCSQVLLRGGAAGCQHCAPALHSERFIPEL